MALEDDIATLTVVVQRMINESGDSTDFDVRVWLDQWLMTFAPALGDRRPLDVLKESGGLDVVRNTLLRAQSGAYS